MPIGYGPPYGLGSSSAAPVRTGGTLLDAANGVSWGSRKIDPVTRDYVVGSNGRIEGTSDIQHLVHMAVSTELGSSAVRNLGQQLRLIERISPNFQSLVRATLERAVQHLVDSGFIEVVDTTVEVVRPGVASARLIWRDLTLSLNDPNSVQETAV
jgi:hypothetical protein